MFNTTAISMSKSNTTSEIISMIYIKLKIEYLINSQRTLTSSLSQEQHKDYSRYKLHIICKIYLLNVLFGLQSPLDPTELKSRQIEPTLTDPN